MKKFITITVALLMINFMSAQVTAVTFTPSFLTFTIQANGGGYLPATKRTADSVQYETGVGTPSPILTNSASPVNLGGVYDSVRVKVKIALQPGYFDGDVKVVVNGDTTLFLNNADTINDLFNRANTDTIFYYNKKVVNNLSTVKIDFIHKTSVWGGNELRAKYSKLTVTAYSTTPTSTVVTDVGINEVAAPVTMLSAFPNPSNGTFSVKFDTKERVTPIGVYDLSGRMVYADNSEREIGSNTVAVDSIPTGMYFVKAGTSTFKIIVR